MAKNIIALNGSSIGAMTLYTVPTGRVSKVVVNYFSTAWDGTYGSPTLIVGSSMTYGSSTSAHIPLFFTSISGVDIGENHIAFGGSNGTSASAPVAVLPKTMYLPAGATIILSGGSGIFASKYNLLVVEEY